MPQAIGIPWRLSLPKGGGCAKLCFVRKDHSKESLEALKSGPFSILSIIPSGSCILVSLVVPQSLVRWTLPPTYFLKGRVGEHYAPCFPLVDLVSHLHCQVFWLLYPFSYALLCISFEFISSWLLWNDCGSIISFKLSGSFSGFIFLLISQHLLIVDYVPGTMLTDLYTLSYLILTISLLDCYLLSNIIR